jgi:glycosyltransferase involved in cell wall biosynthesis
MDSLRELSKRIDALTPTFYKFLIVDNGSSDPSIYNHLEIGGENWSGARTPINLGFGGGILFGIEACETPWVGWMPGNLKIDPSDLPEFISRVNFVSQSLVKAKRVRRTRLSSLKTNIAGLIQSAWLRKNMMDTGGTPTFCEKSFALSLKNPPQDYVFESFVLYSAIERGFLIKRPSIRYGERHFGESHWQNGLRAEVVLLGKIISSSKTWKDGKGI